ncbi:MAG: hypothetical protein ACR5K7_03155 [Symbiopectobacterium sp.]
MSTAAKLASLVDVTLTFYQEHPTLHMLHMQKVDYEQWYLGEAEARYLAEHVNCYLLLKFSLFALLYELPLLRSLA